MFLVMLLIALIISFIYFYTLEYCAGVMIFTVCFLGILGLAGLGLFLWLRYLDVKDKTEFDPQIANTYKFWAWVSWGASLLFLILIVCLWSRIKLAIKIIKASSDFITDKKSVLLSPILAILQLSLFFIFWSLSFIYVFSVGEVRYD